MRKSLSCGVLFFALIGTPYLSAQEPTAAQAQQHSFPAQQQQPSQTTAPDGTNPGTIGGQPQAPLANQAAPADIGPAQNNTASTGDAGPAAPIGATRQTMPSTISAENAAQDKLPTIAFQFQLTDEQKKLISASAAATPTSQGADGLKNIGVQNLIPSKTDATEFSAEVKQQLPGSGRYKYVKAETKILIVDMPNQIVVGEIPL